MEGLASVSCSAPSIQEPHFLDDVSALIGLEFFTHLQFANLVGVGTSGDFRSLWILCFGVRASCET